MEISIPIFYLNIGVGIDQSIQSERIQQNTVFIVIEGNVA